jgi:hypothetical protein
LFTNTYSLFITLISLGVTQMKVVLKNLLHKSMLSLLGISLLAGPIVGCGDAEDPDAVSIDELKAPGNLWIRDGGNGAVTLFWNGSNYEDDFDGYNVFGMIDDGTLLGDYEEGMAVKMLDEEGEPVAEAKTFIAKFSYDPAKPFAEAHTATDDDGEQKVAALPIRAATDPIYPTCGHDSDKTAAEGNCVMHSTDFAHSSAGDDSTRGVAGQMGFLVSDLTPGSKYCFFVMASMDEGKKVSNSTTNIACVTPRYSVSGDLDVPAASGQGQFLDIQTLLTACTDGDCGSISTADADGATSDSATGLYVEGYSDGGLTAGSFTGLVDLGYYPDGFTDGTLPRKAPTYTVGTLDGKTPVNSSGGYAPYGETIQFLTNHMYVMAVPSTDYDTDSDDSPTEFFYHWMYVTGTGEYSSTTAVELRLGAKLDAR